MDGALTSTRETQPNSTLMPSALSARDLISSPTHSCRPGPLPKDPVNQKWDPCETFLLDTESTGFSFRVPLTCSPLAFFLLQWGL